VHKPATKTIFHSTPIALRTWCWVALRERTFTSRRCCCRRCRTLDSLRLRAWECLWL